MNFHTTKTNNFRKGFFFPSAKFEKKIKAYFAPWKYGTLNQHWFFSKKAPFDEEAWGYTAHVVVVFQEVYSGKNLRM